MLWSCFSMLDCLQSARGMRPKDERVREKEQKTKEKKLKQMEKTI